MAIKIEAGLKAQSPVGQRDGMPPLGSHIGEKLLITTDSIVTPSQIFPTGFTSEKVTPTESIERARKAKLSLLNNAVAVHDREGTVAGLVTESVENRVTQYLVTDEGVTKFRETTTAADGRKKETVDETLFNSIDGAWIVPVSTYGPHHMMYMYFKEDVDGLPNLPDYAKNLYLKQQVNMLQHLQKLNEEGVEDGEQRDVKMGINRSYSVKDGGLRSIYRLHVHSWRNGHNYSPEQALDLRDKQEGYDGGVSAYLGQEMAYDLRAPASEYWDTAEVFADNMGTTIWLPGFTPEHLLDNKKGKTIIDGLLQPIDVETDRQLDRVHRTAFHSERQDVIRYMQGACAQGVFSDVIFQKYFEHSRESEVNENYITNPTVLRRIYDLRDRGLLRMPAGSAMGIEFIPEGSDIGPEGARISISPVITRGVGIGTAEVTQVTNVVRDAGGGVTPEEMNGKIVKVYSKLVTTPKTT